MVGGEVGGGELEKKKDKGTTKGGRERKDSGKESI